MNKDKNIEKINILTLGDSSVGKTSFILRYTEEAFTEVYLSTMGIDYKSKILKINNKKYMVIFFDTAGQEKYRSISFNVIKNAHGVILMYDITNKSSFDSITKWMGDIRNAKGNDFPVLLLGNKIDNEEKRQVSKNQGEQLAQQYGIDFFETSNKVGTNINESSLAIINKIIEEREKAKSLAKDYEILNDKNTIKLDRNAGKGKKKKCNCKK